MDARTVPAGWHDVAEAVQVLAPTSGQPLERFLTTPVEAGVEPFPPARLRIVGLLSAAFLEDPVLRHDPASVALAYWMRPAAVARLAARYRRRAAEEPSVVRVPVGRVFHVAPANVDTLFLYSWALAYLCGNTSVVRLSQERSPDVAAMLAAIEAVAGREPDLRDHNRFVTYAHDDTLTAALSGWCTHRVLWGGDETVAALRPLPLNPHASERVFGSKFSYAALSAPRWLAADAAERARVAAGFFNDLFWFDQMACSSPHVVFWVGPPADCDRAVDEFERALQVEVERRAYAPTVSHAVRRLIYAFDLAADADVRVRLEHPGFVGIEVRDLRWLDRQACGGGLIRHARLERLDELERFAGEADQTLTWFGFEPAELVALATRIGVRGVDRIVPIGQALAFDVIWDGYDLIEDLVRRVAVHER